jgi:hypothetical protein
MEVIGQFHYPAALPPGVGWTPEPVWTVYRSENSLPYRDSNSDPWSIRQIEKNAFTSAGLEPATFPLVAQCLNHWAIACPRY